MTTLSHRQRRKQFLQDTILQQSVKGNYYADTESARIVIFPDRHCDGRWQFMLIRGEQRPQFFGKSYPSIRKALAAGYDACKS